MTSRWPGWWRSAAPRTKRRRSRDNGARWIVQSYLGARHRPVLQQNFAPAEVDPVRHYLDEVILHGTPEAVIEQILRLRDEIGLDYLLCAPLSHQTFMLLTEEVLPRFA